MGSQQYVIMIFMRGENTMDKKRHQIYRDEIIIPFIAQCIYKIMGDGRLGYQLLRN